MRLRGVLKFFGRPQAHGPHSGTVVPVVLKEPTPPPLLRLGQWASALQPGAERPDSLADVPGASVWRNRVADQRKVADQLPVPRLLSGMEPVRPQPRNAQGVGVPALEPGDELRVIPTQPPYHLEVVLAPGDDPSITVFGAQDDDLDGLPEPAHAGTRRLEVGVDDHLRT